MSRILFLALLLFAVATAQAQTEKRIYTQSERESMSPNGQKERERRKQLEAMEDSLNFVRAVEAIEKLDFVLEANRLTFKRGQREFVNSTTNFVALQDEHATVQVAPFYGGGGPNGVGGTTLDGRASNIILRTDKKGNVTLTMSVMGTGLSATVSISMAKGSNRASVTVNPNFHSNRVTLDGVLIPSSQSNMFKGRAF